MKRYPKLFEPIVLPNGVTIKNRMESTPSGLHFLQGPEPYPNEAVIEHYVNRAKSGAGIVVVTGCSTGSHPNPGHDQNWDMSDGHNQHYVAQLVEGIHAYGAKALHRGLDINEFLMAADAFASGENGNAFLGNNYDVSTGIASAYVVGDGSAPRYDGIECPKKLMLECADKLADFCLSLKRNCGFDGIWIHGAYRHQFIGRCLSPLTNKRMDEFGGSIENMVRYPRLVFRKIKEKCGKSFIVELSISGHDPEGMGGNTLEDTCKMAKLLEGCVDILQVKGPLIDESHPVQFHEETPWLYMAEAVKKSAPNIAVMTVGGCFYPETNEGILAEGKADMIGMARTWISNPDYCDRLKAGREEDIVPCIRCNKCHRSSDSASWTSVCSVNPLIGLEGRVEHMVKPAGGKQKIAVIGGGPSGMKAAIELCDRGHDVTIYEKNAALGGLLCIMKDVSFKWPLTRLKEHLIAQVKKRPICILLKTEPTVEMLQKEDYDAVFAATGSEPVIPPLPGVDGENVMTAVDAYTHVEEVGENVVIIGGGEIGVETGIWLARMGKNVTVLGRNPKLAADSTPVHYWKMFRDEWESCETLRTVTGAAVTGITERGVTYTDAEGVEHFVSCENVLLAVGLRGRIEDARRYYEAANRFEMVGDCIGGGSIQKCMRSAYITANQY